MNNIIESPEKTEDLKLLYNKLYSICNLKDNNISTLEVQGLRLLLEKLRKKGTLPIYCDSDSIYIDKNDLDKFINELS